MQGKDHTIVPPETSFRISVHSSSDLWPVVDNLGKLVAALLIFKNSSIFMAWLLEVFIMFYCMTAIEQLPSYFWIPILRHVMLFRLFVHVD